jgi:hypothetical protein
VDEVRIDPSILLFGLGISVVTGVFFGLVPALRASRADLTEAIKQSVRPGFGSVRSRVRDLLVVSQIALAFVLVIGTALLSRSLFLLVNVDPGFDFHNVLSLSMVVYGNLDRDWDRTKRRKESGALTRSSVLRTVLAPRRPSSPSAPARRESLQCQDGLV